MKNNRLDLYKRTVDKLFNAYFNNTLAHGQCSACAVGNILDGCISWGSLFMTFDYKEGKGMENLRAKEGEVLFTSTDIPYLTIKKLSEIFDPELREWYEMKEKNARKAINASGYTIEELSDVEYAFEMANKGSSDEDYMFNGLVAVLDVLAEIHEIDDNEEDVKRFSSEHRRKLELT